MFNINDKWVAECIDYDRLGKLPLGKLQICKITTWKKYPWKLASREKAFGKVFYSILILQFAHTPF